ncbi:MAG TPA: DUF3395 domain-containing protein [Planctomycetota bacterium]|jgi:hypothetical protein
MKKLVHLCIALLITASLFAVAEDKPAKAPAKLEIVKAVYGDLAGDAKAQTDVTDKVKAMVKPGQNLNVDATNDNFGDPIEGTAKKLKIEYTLDGQKADQTVDENATLTITVIPSKLVIEKAWYGNPDDAKVGSDVTTKVRTMIKNDSLTVDATNDNFGDPAEGVAKVLKIDYTFDGGAKKSKQAAENESLTINDKGE